MPMSDDNIIFNIQKINTYNEIVNVLLVSYS